MAEIGLCTVTFERHRPKWPAPPKYLAIGHLFFESLDAFQLAFATHGGPIVADVPNYTNTQPIIQVNEVRM